MSRRSSLSAIVGAVGAVIFGGGNAKAQFTEQEVINAADIVSTGDVELNQSASGSQVVDINGWPITGDGIYSEVVVNDGRIVSTGDVSVNQSASASQEVEVSYPEYSGQPAEGACRPGTVIANPNTGQVFYQGRDCCWYAACANRCQSNRGCEGDICG
jgi:hypothetical protein